MNDTLWGDLAGLAERLDPLEERVDRLVGSTPAELLATIDSGSVNTCLIRAGELFRTALKMQSVAIVIAHNHPGRHPTPGPDDVRVTENIVAAGSAITYTPWPAHRSATR